MVYLKVRNHLGFLSKTLVWLFVCFCLRCVCVLFLCAVECESSCATPAAVQAPMYQCKHYFASSNYFRMILLYFWSCESCLVFLAGYQQRKWLLTVQLLFTAYEIKIKVTEVVIMLEVYNDKSNLRYQHHLLRRQITLLYPFELQHALKIKYWTFEPKNTFL